MANYANLRSAIQQVVKTNGNNEITGALLQQSLIAMINSLGGYYQFAGIATPSTNPGTPDQNVFYLASTAGTYSNFGSLVLAENEAAILKYNGTWSKDSSGFATSEKVNQLRQEIGHVIDTSLQGRGSNWAVLNDSYVFKAGKPLTVKLTGPLTFAGTLSGQSFLRLYTKHADTHADGVTLFSLTGAAESFNEKTITYTPPVDVTLSVEGRWQTTEYLKIEVVSNLIQEVASLESAVATLPSSIADQQNKILRGMVTVIHSGGINFNNTAHQAEITGMILASRTALNTRLSVQAANVDYSFNQGNTSAVWLCYNLAQSVYRFVSAGQNTVDDIFIAALLISGNSSANPNTSKVERVWFSPVECTINGVNIFTRVSSIEDQITNQLPKKLRGNVRAFTCGGINFNNSAHKAEVNGLLFSNPTNNSRQTVNPAEVQYTFSAGETSAVWLVYNIAQSTFKFISAGTISNDELFLAAVTISGRPTTSPDSTKVEKVLSSLALCTIDGESIETKVDDVVAKQATISSLLGEHEEAPDFGLLSTKTIWQSSASADTGCLCYEKFIKVLGGVVNCFHASDITIRIIEYDENKQYITQTGYAAISRVVLQSNTMYVRIAANYGGRGYGSSNPISVNDFVAGDFGFTYPGSIVSDKIRIPLIDRYEDKPYFVDASTWKNLGSAYHVRIIPVTAGKKILVKSNNSVNTRIAFLNTFDEDYILENMPCPVDGIGNQNTVAGGNITLYTVPQECTYIALNSVYANANALPASLIIDGVEYMSPSVVDLRSVIEYFDTKTDPEIETRVNNIEKGVLTSILGRNMVRDAAVRATGVKAVTEDIKPFSFIHVSDIHTKSGNFKCFKNACEFYQHYDNIAIMIVTGDLVWDDNQDPMDYYNEALASTSKPVLNVVGNHDSGQWHVDLQSVTTDKQCYDKVIAPYVSSWDVIQPADAATNGKSYYYKDFTDQKVRLIVINEFETDYEIDPNDATKLKYSREFRAMRQAQVTWLINTLTNTPSDYGVIFAMHQPLGLLGAEDNPFVSFDLVDNSRVLNVYSADTEWLAKIIDAYARKTSLSLTVSQTGAVVTTLDCSCDFSSVESEFICVICGHTHQDYVGHLKNYPNIPILCVGADNLQYTSTFQPRAEGTPSEDLFNVVNIDRNRKTIKIVRIGSDASVTGQVRDQMIMSY